MMAYALLDDKEKRGRQSEKLVDDQKLKYESVRVVRQVSSVGVTEDAQ